MSLGTNVSHAAVHGVGEWAKHSVNLQDGCENNCRYCYAKCMAIRFKRKTSQNWDKPDIRRKDIDKVYRTLEGRIMFPTTHDISRRNLEECISVLWKMLEAGNKVLIVSKPTMHCIPRLCSELGPYCHRILYRFTIGSSCDDTLRFWEPGAPSFSERLASLKWAYEQGFQTSVSAEPMLDTHINRVIHATKPYVTDAIWLGRANRLRSIIAINCPNDDETKQRADELLAEQTDDYLRELYERYRDDSQIKFKDSIKKAAGLDRPTERGLDV